MSFITKVFISGPFSLCTDKSVSRYNHQYLAQGGIQHSLLTLALQRSQTVYNHIFYKSFFDGQKGKGSPIVDAAVMVKIEAFTYSRS